MIKYLQCFGLKIYEGRSERKFRHFLFTLKLYYQNKIKNYTMASLIIHLAPFFDIFATDIEIFVAPCNRFEETTLVKFGALRSKELSHRLLHFSIVFEATPWEWDFQCKEQLKVWRSKIGAVGRVTKSPPTGVTNLILFEHCCTWSCVVVPGLPLATTLSAHVCLSPWFELE